MSDWLNRGRALAGAYTKGQVAGIEGKVRSACPYEDGIVGSQPERFARAWKAGWDNVKQAAAAAGGGR